jgi:hypothetical protein
MLDVGGRLTRLEELSRGLARELVILREGKDELLYLERRAYINAVQDMLTAAESARVTLAKAVARLKPAPAADEPQPGLRAT